MSGRLLLGSPCTCPSPVGRRGRAAGWQAGRLELSRPIRSSPYRPARSTSPRQGMDDVVDLLRSRHTRKPASGPVPWSEPGDRTHTDKDASRGSTFVDRSGAVPVLESALPARCDSPGREPEADPRRAALPSSRNPNPVGRAGDRPGSSTPRGHGARNRSPRTSLLTSLSLECRQRQRPPARALRPGREARSRTPVGFGCIAGRF